jgi:hypothetical protein
MMLYRSWKEVRSLLAAILDSLRDLFYFSGVLILFVFIYAIAGRQIFQGFMIGDDGVRVRNHFDSFGWSCVTVFQVMTPENWNQVLYDAVNARGWGGAVYLVSLYLIGNYIVLSLFLAIMLGNFDKAQQEKEEKMALRNSHDLPNPPVPRTATSITDTFVASAIGGFPVQVFAPAPILSPVNEQMTRTPHGTPIRKGFFSRLSHKFQVLFDKWEGPEPTPTLQQLERERKRNEAHEKVIEEELKERNALEGNDMYAEHYALQCVLTPTPEHARNRSYQGAAAGHHGPGGQFTPAAVRHFNSLRALQSPLPASGARDSNVSGIGLLPHQRQPSSGSNRSLMSPSIVTPLRDVSAALRQNAEHKAKNTRMPTNPTPDTPGVVSYTPSPLPQHYLPPLRESQFTAAESAAADGHVRGSFADDISPAAVVPTGSFGLPTTSPYDNLSPSTLQAASEPHSLPVVGLPPTVALPAAGHRRTPSEAENTNLAHLPMVQPAKHAAGPHRRVASWQQSDHTLPVAPLPPARPLPPRPSQQQQQQQQQSLPSSIDSPSAPATTNNKPSIAEIPVALLPTLDVPPTVSLPPSSSVPVIPAPPAAAIADNGSRSSSPPAFQSITISFAGPKSPSPVNATSTRSAASVSQHQNQDSLRLSLQSPMMQAASWSPAGNVTPTPTPAALGFVLPTPYAVAAEIDDEPVHEWSRLVPPSTHTPASSKSNVSSNNDIPSVPLVSTPSVLPSPATSAVATVETMSPPPIAAATPSVVSPSQLQQLSFASLLVSPVDASRVTPPEVTTATSTTGLLDAIFPPTPATAPMTSSSYTSASPPPFPIALLEVLAQPPTPPASGETKTVSSSPLAVAATSTTIGDPTPSSIDDVSSPGRVRTVIQSWPPPPPATSPTAATPADLPTGPAVATAVAALAASSSPKRGGKRGNTLRRGRGKRGGRGGTIPRVPLPPPPVPPTAPAPPLPVEPISPATPSVSQGPLPDVDIASSFSAPHPANRAIELMNIGSSAQNLMTTPRGPIQRAPSERKVRFAGDRSPSPDLTVASPSDTSAAAGARGNAAVMSPPSSNMFHNMDPSATLPPEPTIASGPPSLVRLHSSGPPVADVHLHIDVPGSGAAGLPTTRHINGLPVVPGLEHKPHEHVPASSKVILTSRIPHHR